MGDRPHPEGRVQVRVDVCIGSECVCVNGWEKEDHLYTVGKLFLRVTVNMLKHELKFW